MSKHRTSDGRYSFTIDRPCVCGHSLDFHTAEKPRACGNYGTGLIDCDCKNYKPSRTKIPAVVRLEKETTQ